MSLKPRTWLLISLLSFLGAAVFWELGKRESAKRNSSHSPNAVAPAAAPSAGSAAPPAATLLSATPARLAYVVSNLFPEPPKSKYPFRLHNSPAKISELSRRDDSLLLANAMLDLRQPLQLAVPESLRPRGETENYVVQARSLIDAGFRRLLADVRAEVVSYVPNNAFLVRVDPGKVKALEASPLVRTVIPWIPYFKLAPSLMALAVETPDSTEERSFRLVIFAKELEAVLAELRLMNVEVIGRSPSPFGIELVVKAPGRLVTALAQNDRVQWIDPYTKRVLVNDLANLKLGTATNGGLDAQYLGLSGKNVKVNVNDTGVDASHPDLAGRVVDGDLYAHDDLDGHGTHVAGIIASSGKSLAAMGTNSPPGSATNATFQGKAPEAIIVPLPIDPFLGSFLGDNYLQETAATNGVFISNNSWGYLGVPDYDTAAASFDAAVRDSSRFITGDQAISYVFSAGNSGDGTDEGTDGIAGSISSPATAKNVITVGALESLRRITNGPVSTNAVGEMETNSFFYADTDNDKQIASYSSRGNVGPTLEGDFGRFKPDVVAPGSFIISTRAKNWADPQTALEQIPLGVRSRTVEPLSTNLYTLLVSDNSIRATIRVLPNAASPVPFPDLLLGIRKGGPPPPNDFVGTNFVQFPITSGGEYGVSVVNTLNQPVNFDLFAVITLTNPPIASEYFTELKKLNDQVGPNYRYETGTSMAAPAVSGMLALMYDFFTNHVGTNIAVPSPALAKALLINSCQSVDEQYNFRVNTSLNLQGWGRPEMARIIPGVMYSNVANPSSWPVQFFDQGTTRSPAPAVGRGRPLATGESETRIITFDPTNNPASIQSGLKITLVWTDPPGNPGVGIKLVNDLDLIVTNLSSPTHEVYIGNMIKGDAIFNEAVEPAAGPELDIINNVENVILEGPLAAQYSVTVRAKRVNVNAVTGYPTEILQDYALVISVGDLTLTNAFKIGEPSLPNFPLVQSPVPVITLTNKIPLLSERAGAHSPVVVGTNGTYSQWRFYEFVPTNRYTAVFIANKGNLSRARLDQADVDLYVSTDPTLHALDPFVLEECIRQGQFSSDNQNGASRTRTGSELVVFNDSQINQTYFVAVRAEDQSAGEYILGFISQDKPFGVDNNGCQEITFISVPTLIPDGANLNPQGVNLFQPAVFVAVGAKSTLIGNTSIRVKFRHESPGDVTALLKPPTGPVVTLFSHSLSSLAPGALHTLEFDDNPNPTAPGTLPTEGPIHMNAWVGNNAVGVWQFAIYDEAPFYAGLVEEATLCIVPHESCEISDNPAGCLRTIGAYDWVYDFIDVPFDATKLEICVSENPLPLEIYLRKGLNRPTTNDWDAFEVAVAAPDLPAGESESCLLLDGFSSPPLSPGRYQLGIYNNNSSSQTFRLKIRITRGLLSDSYVTYVSPIPKAGATITDEAMSWMPLNILTNRRIVDARVGIRLDHSRASDLSIHLVTPRGTRWLLSENRGNSQADGFGSTFGENGLQGPVEQILTNYSWVTFTDSTNLADGEIKFVPVDSVVPPFRSTATGPLPTVFESDFDAELLAHHTPTKPTASGWEVLTNAVAITNDPTILGLHTNCLALSDGAVSIDLDVRTERQYRLQFSYRKDSSSQTQEVVFPVGLSGGSLPAADPLRRTISPAVLMPKLRLRPGQPVRLSAPVTEEITVDTVNGTKSNPEGLPGPGGRFAGFRSYALLGQWSSSATSLNPLTVESAPFAISTNLVVSAPEAPGDYYLWLSINDADFTDNGPEVFNVTARWQPAQVGSFRYVLNGVTNRLFATEYWQTNQFRFIGRRDEPRLMFLSDWNSTVCIDSIKVQEPIAAAYYLAEEPLPTAVKLEAATPEAPLVEVPSVRGETTEGAWRLEIRDTRAGQKDVASGAGVLWSWYLQLLFAPDQQPIPLTNCVPHAGLLRRDQIRYYVVDVPREAITVTNTLFNPDVRLYFSPTKLPDPETDLPVANQQILTIGPGAGDDLAPGSRYFLAVVNDNPQDRSNRYSIRVDFELPMIALTNRTAFYLGQWVRYTDNFTNELVAPTNYTLTSNILYPGTNMHWYKHTVEPLPFLRAAVYELHSTNRELHMVVKRGLAEVDYLPTPTRYDYHSINYQDTNEFILVHRGSFPVSLTPIPWIIGVYNSGTNTATYDIAATVWTNIPPTTAPVPVRSFSIDTNLITLTNQVAVDLQPGESVNYYYCFNTSQTNSALLVELLHPSADLDLFLRRSDVPSPYLYDFSDLQLGTNSEHISIHTNLFVPRFGVQTNWYFNVVNNSSTRATGIVSIARASQGVSLQSAQEPTIDAAAGPLFGVQGLTIRWRSLAGERYRILYGTAALGPFDQLLGIITATSSRSEFTDPDGVDGSRFYRVEHVIP